MRNVVDIARVVFGSLCVGFAVWCLANAALTPLWSRAWVLSRLLTTTQSQQLRQQHTPNVQPNTTVADFLEAVAREVHSGYSLSLAYVNSVERFPNQAWWTSQIAQHCVQGQPFAVAISLAASPLWTADVLLATRTLSVASNGGFGVVTALEKSASILRERQHIANERSAQTAQIRLSTSVLSWIPIVICTWVLTNQPTTRTFLLGTPFGVMCLVTGLVLNLGGRAWISRIAHSSS